MLKTHLIIGYKPKTNFDSKASGSKSVGSISREVLSDIADYLKTNKVECSKIKEGAWVLSCLCLIKQTKVSIVVGFLSNSSFEEASIIGVTCANYFSCWRWIFNRPKDEEVYSGETLQEFVKLVDDIIRKNDRITVHREWMDRSEYLSAIRSKEVVVTKELLKDPLRKKGFWDV